MGHKEHQPRAIALSGQSEGQHVRISGGSNQQKVCVRSKETRPKHFLSMKQLRQNVGTLWVLMSTLYQPTQPFVIDGHPFVLPRPECGQTITTNEELTTKHQAPDMTSA